ncbi:MAG: M18 family aminopeptidase, partial [Solobacterium sp.]|nr:M18 family aminopeptidase [Solobacterium sp.]
LGHLSLNHVSLTSVDIGLAQLAMHSPYEMCGVKDAASLIKAMKVFYSSSLSEKKDGSRSIQ